MGYIYNPFSGQFDYSGSVSSGVVPLGSNLLWTHSESANPTTRLDGSALVAGDQIRVPISDAVPHFRSGLWEWNGSRWLSPDPMTWSYRFSNFPVFSSVVNFPHLTTPTDGSIDYLVQQLFLHGVPATNQTDTNRYDLEFRYDAHTSSGANSTVTLTTATTNGWNAGEHRNTTYPLNILLETYPVPPANKAAFWRLSSVLATTIGNPGIVGSPKADFTVRKVRR